MKRGSRVLLFLVIIIIILIAVAFFVLRGGIQLPGAGGPTATPPSPMVSVVFVEQPINRDDPINPESLTLKPYPQELVTEKMIRTTDEITGKYAAFPLSQGMMVTTDMLADRPGLNQPGSDAAKVISPGLVAISIPITRLGSVSYGIRDGDRVNVIATTRFVDVDPNFQTKLPNHTAVVTGTGFMPDALPILSAGINSGGASAAQGRAELDPTINQAIYLVPSESQRSRLVSQMILQDIQVLHIGDFVLASQENADTQQPPVQEGQPTPTGTPVNVSPPDVITLIVTPQDAVSLTYFLNSGTQFTLTLRAPDDTSRVETEAATLQFLLSQYAIPLPSKLPYVIDMPSPAATEPAP